MTATEKAPQTSSLGLTPLITGIIDDAQTLVRQEVSLFKNEVKSDFERGMDAVVPLSIGLAISSLAGLFILMTAAHITVHFWTEVPLFAAYGVIGLALAMLGGGILFIGKRKVDAIKQSANRVTQELQNKRPSSPAK